MVDRARGPQGPPVDRPGLADAMDDLPREIPVSKDAGTIMGHLQFRRWDDAWDKVGICLS